MDTNIQILFFRIPELGNVKTRLANSIGDNLALAIYKSFIDDMIQTSQSVAADKVVAVSTGDADNKYLEEYSYYDIINQAGEDLGARMYSAFNTVFDSGYSKAVMIGSDCPDLPASTINQAFGNLTDHDIVLGPSADGGYYLIGLNNYSLNESLFEKINWSTASVLGETISRIYHLGFNFILLEEREDIDEINSLQRFYQRNLSDSDSLCTMKFLEKNKEDFNGWL